MAAIVKIGQVVSHQGFAFFPYLAGFLHGGVGQTFALLGLDGFLLNFQLKFIRFENVLAKKLLSHQLAYLRCQDRVL